MKVPILLPNIFNHPFTYESSHLNLKIGDYVRIAGGSAVLNDVLKGRVGGNPAVPLREYVKLRNKK